MNHNIRIAKQLVRIAKELTASGTPNVWQVWSIDCWGNEQDGRDFNDRSRVWTFICDGKADERTIQDEFEISLEEHGCRTYGLEYDWYGENECQVNNAKTGEYLWQFELTNEHDESDDVLDKESFISYAKDELSDDLIDAGDWQGMHAFVADTNGNDHLYALHIFAADDGVYFSDQTIDEDTIRDDPENFEIEVDDFHNYLFQRYPFEKADFKEFIDHRIDSGIEDGLQAFTKCKQDGTIQ